MTGDVAAGSLAGTHAGHDGCIGLQFAVNLQVGVHLLGQAGSLNHLVDTLMLGAAFGRETEHGNLGVVDFGQSACGAVGAHGNLCQLLGIGVGNHGAVGKHHHAIVAVGRALGQEHQEGATHGADAGSGLQYLEGGAQHVARGVHRTGNLAVGITGLDEQATQVQRVKHLLAGVLDSHTLGLAQFIEQLRILLDGFGIVGIDDRSLVDVVEPKFGGFGHDVGLVANEYHVSNAVGDDAVGSRHGAGFGTLGKDDALPVGNRVAFEFLK